MQPRPACTTMHGLAIRPRGTYLWPTVWGYSWTFFEPYACLHCQPSQCPAPSPPLDCPVPTHFTHPPVGTATQYHACSCTTCWGPSSPSLSAPLSAPWRRGNGPAARRGSRRRASLWWRGTRQRSAPSPAAGLQRGRWGLGHDHACPIRACQHSRNAWASAACHYCHVLWSSSKAETTKCSMQLCACCKECCGAW